MYDPKNLSVLAYANGFTHWHYRTERDNVLEEYYWNDAADMLREGDMITVNVFLPRVQGFTLVVTRKISEWVVVVEKTS